MPNDPKGLTRAAEILPGIIADESPGDISVARLKQAEGAELVRLRREQHAQVLGYSSRPFVLCGLPVRRPPAGTLVHTRRNGKFVLEVVAHPNYGLPYGQDRLLPIFLATLAMRQGQTIKFKTAAEILDTFGLPRDGPHYRRLVAGFERIFGATLYFGTETQTERARVIHQGRFNFLREVQLWFSKDPGQQVLPGDFENIVVLTDEFYHETVTHPIPADLTVVTQLANAPATLDLFLWLCWRCWKAGEEPESIPLFGSGGLASQLGSVAYARERRFRERLAQWLRTVRAVWPECPAVISPDGQSLIVRRAQAVLPRAAVDRAGFAR
jgi:hypothetical protein